MQRRVRVRTTQIYTHVLNRGGLGVRSPMASAESIVAADARRQVLRCAPSFLHRYQEADTHEDAGFG